MDQVVLFDIGWNTKKVKKKGQNDCYEPYVIMYSLVSFFVLCKSSHLRQVKIGKRERERMKIDYAR